MFFPSWFGVDKNHGFECFGGGQKVTGLNVLVMGIEKWRSLPIMTECLLKSIFKVSILGLLKKTTARADFLQLEVNIQVECPFTFLAFCLGCK